MWGLSPWHLFFTAQKIKKSLMENFICCAMFTICCDTKKFLWMCIFNIESTSRYFSVHIMDWEKKTLVWICLHCVIKERSNRFLDAHSSFFKTLFGIFPCVCGVLSSAQLATSVSSLIKKIYKYIEKHRLRFQGLWLLIFLLFDVYSLRNFS